MPRSTTGYDDDDDVARVVAFVLSLQRLHSARFNILTKIPGATGGGRGGGTGGTGDKGGLRSMKRGERQGRGERGKGVAVAVRRDVTGQNFPGVQPRERSLDVQPPKTGGRKMRIRGLKFPRADVAPDVTPSFVDGKLARSTHESSGRVRGRGGEAGGRQRVARRWGRGEASRASYLTDSTSLRRRTATAKNPDRGRRKRNFPPFPLAGPLILPILPLSPPPPVPRNSGQRRA